MAEFNLAHLGTASNKFVFYMVPVQYNVPENRIPMALPAPEEIVGTLTNQEEPILIDPTNANPPTNADHPPKNADKEVEGISENAEQQNVASNLDVISIRSSPAILGSDISTVRFNETVWYSEPTVSDYGSPSEEDTDESRSTRSEIKCSTVLIASGSAISPAYLNELRCLCRVTQKLESMELITCLACQTNQHIACNGYTKISSVPRPYFCYCCQKAQTEGISDIRMEVQRAYDRQVVALLRLCVMYYEKHKDIQGVLDSINLEECTMILNKFRRWKILEIDQNGHYTFSEGFSQKVLNSVYFYKAPRVITGVFVLE